MPVIRRSACVVRQGEAGADADLQHVAAGEAVHQGHGAAARQQADAAEHRIIDARPAAVGGTHSLGVHGCSRSGAAL